MYDDENKDFNIRKEDDEPMGFAENTSSNEFSEATHADNEFLNKPHVSEPPCAEETSNQTQSNMSQQTEEASSDVQTAMSQQTEEAATEMQADMPQHEEALHERSSQISMAALGAINADKANNTENTANTDYNETKEKYYKETVKKPKKPGTFKRFIAACLTISLFGGIGIGSSYAVVDNLVFNKDKTESNVVDMDAISNMIKESVNNTENGKTTEPNLLSAALSGGDAISVIDSVYPSVVNITITVHSTGSYYGFSMPYDGEGAGSGIIFDEDDNYVYIVTNNHVVEDANSIAISVTGEESIEASLVGTDSTADVAVIKALKSDFKDNAVDYKIAKFGDSDNLKVGESVLAIGNALGEGKSVTDGMISVLNKTISIDGKELEVIQTSSPINPGNSGGALVDYSGNIIGMNTAKTDTTVAEGMGYAIPSNTVKALMEQILTDGTVPKPYLGIMGSDITDELSEAYNLPAGVLVRQILPDGSAEKAGLQEGDVITSFNGKTVLNMAALQNTLKDCEVGAQVEMKIIREGQSETLTVTIKDANAQ